MKQFIALFGIGRIIEARLRMQPTTKSIIQKIESSYAKILPLYRGVPVTLLVRPVLANGWSVKDILAHIAAWDWRGAALLEGAQETNWLLRATPDVAGLNREFYQERRDWRWPTVKADSRRAHQALLAAIRRLPSQRLADPLVQQTIAQNTWQHYQAHLADLERWHRAFVGRRLSIS